MLSRETSRWSDTLLCRGLIDLKINISPFLHKLLLILMEVILLGLKKVYTHHKAHNSSLFLLEHSAGRINFPIKTQTTRFKFFVLYLIAREDLVYTKKEKLLSDFKLNSNCTGIARRCNSDIENKIDTGGRTTEYPALHSNRKPNCDVACTFQ